MNKNTKFDYYTGRQAPVARKPAMTPERAQAIYEAAVAKMRAK